MEINAHITTELTNIDTWEAKKLARPERILRGRQKLKALAIETQRALTALDASAWEY